MKKYLAILLIPLSLSFHSSSQGMRFRKYDLNSGLTHNSVLSLLQDNEGLIWIGTRDGLNRFNGLDYEVYVHNFSDSKTLSNNQINCLFESSDKSIWAGTANGLNRYRRNTDSFDRFMASGDSTGITGNYVRCIFETKDGILWIGASSGLNLFDPQKSCFKHLYLNNDTSHASNNVISIYSEDVKNIWVGTRGGLFLLKDNVFQRIILDEAVELHHDRFEIRDIQKDPDGIFWIGTENYGLYSFRFENGYPVSVQHYYTGNCTIVSDHIRRIFLSPDGGIWLGTLDGLSILKEDPPDFTNIVYSSDDPDGISNNSIRDIIRDKSGGYWIGTYAGGVNYFHPQNNLFPHYKMITGGKNSLSNNVVTDFLEDSNGKVWIATERGGLNHWDPVKNVFIHYFHNNGNSIPDDNVKELAFDKKGNLWIGTFNGLSVFNLRSGTFSNYFRDIKNENSLNNNQVYALFADEDGLIWIGTNGGGLQSIDPDKNLFTSFPREGRSNVNVITEDRFGRLWIGSQGGLTCMERRTRKEIDISPILAGKDYHVIYVQTVTVDSAGRIWIGTQGYGLYLIREDEIFWFNTENGLPDNTVNAVLEEDAGRFWITTNQGLSEIRVSEDSRGIPFITSKQFTINQGVQGKQFYPKSAMISGSGRFYFGGINGFNAFYPSEIRDSTFFPEIFITQINIRNLLKEKPESGSIIKEPVNEIKELRLSYNQRDISIGFIGLDFINPGGIFYRYRLLDLDKDWIDLKTQREINFTYLPAGNFELQIKASTNPDSWSDSFRTIFITVLPPWYLTIYAFIFYVLFVGFLLFIFFRYSQKWAHLKSELAMEHFQREKEDELHKLKMKFFTDVSHELRTPLTLITAPLEKIVNQTDLSNRLRNQLLSIQRNSQRLMLLINKILDLRKLETGHGKLLVAEDNIIDFLKETCLAFQETAGIKNIDLEFITDFKSQNLWYDREKMEIILYNLLSNAMKNTGKGGKIAVRFEIMKEPELCEISDQIKTRGDLAVVSVEDSGTGIPVDKLESIFSRFYTSEAGSENYTAGTGVGLELTKRLVELHKGTIGVVSRVRTESESGFTRFSVYLPADKSNYSEAEIDHDFVSSEDPSQYILKPEREFTPVEVGEADSPEAKHTRTRMVQKQKLLIIEDNGEVRKLICDLFEDQFIIEEAENGLTGWETAVKEIPDLIISDVMMPEMNGIELCRKIKTDIRTSHIPVILLTARTAITFRYEGIETGADDYITKPFSAEYLIIRVKNLIKQRDLMRSHFVKEAICDPGKITVTSIDEKLLKKAVDYITDNISDNSLSVEKLSREIGLSRVHFYRKIKALTNLTAVEFIRNIRLKRAAAILSQGKLTIKEVAAMAGFEDIDYFRKSFKKQFGVKPSDFHRNPKPDQS